MGNNRTVLSDADHENLSIYSVEMLLSCRKKMDELEKLYEREKIVFPRHCRTNLRDAWFHYKKIYERFDSIKVYQEQYAMEERLIRILKDAITVLFNKYAVWLDTTYYLLGNKQVVLERLKSINRHEHAVLRRVLYRLPERRLDTDAVRHRRNVRRGQYIRQPCIGTGIRIFRTARR